MGQFRKSVGRLETDKRLTGIFVKINEKKEQEVQKDQAELPDLSAKAKKIPLAEIISKKD